jgi:drug/metabolite transporter (DMT)-like permease
VYGAGDFLGGLASRRTSTLAVVVWSQAAGFLVLIVALPLVPGTPHPADFAWGGLCGVIGAAAVGLLYRGLAIGAMGVVSPITAVLAALLPVAYGALHRVPVSRAASAGNGLSIVAVVAISGVPPASREQARRGIAQALGAGVMFGLFFIVLAQTRADAGLYPLLGARSASFVVFVLAATGLRLSYRPARGAIRIIVAGGVCDMLANVLYVVAAHAGSLAIVAVLTSLYPASTVGLAAIFLRERLRALQWAGVALALAGVALIGAGR